MNNKYVCHKTNLLLQVEVNRRLYVILMRVTINSLCRKQE